MLDALAGAVSAANAALDMLKRGVAAHDQKIVETAIAEMTDKLRSVSSSALESMQHAIQSTQEVRELDKRIAELESENTKLRAAADERDLYHLVPLSPNTFAYTLKQLPNGASPHYLCQACFDQGKKMVLQRPGGKPYFSCSGCQAQVTSGEFTAEVRESQQRAIAAAGRRNFY